MSTDQYTPDELEFIDRALVGIANACLADPEATSMGAEWVAKEALVLLDARRKIRSAAQPTQATSIANDELITHQFVCTENEIRGVFFWEGGLTNTRGGIQTEFNSNEGIGINQLHIALKLNVGDIIEIRVLKRADR